MNDVEELYDEIVSEGIEVINFKFSSEDAGAVSVCDKSDRCLIAIDEKRCENSADRKSKLFHEYGHCRTGAFYTLPSRYYYRARCEYKADKYIAQNKITKEKIEYANKKEGCTEPWEFAEYFNVTPEYMKRMLNIIYGMEFMD